MTATASGIDQEVSTARTTDPVESTSPGSDAAIAKGCTCPKDQPRAFQGLYWQEDGCPIHQLAGSPTEEDTRATGALGSRATTGGV